MFWGTPGSISVIADNNSGRNSVKECFGALLSLFFILKYECKDKSWKGSAPIHPDRPHESRVSRSPWKHVCITLPSTSFAAWLCPQARKTLPPSHPTPFSPTPCPSRLPPLPSPPPRRPPSANELFSLINWTSQFKKLFSKLLWAVY